MACRTRHSLRTCLRSVRYCLPCFNCSLRLATPLSRRSAACNRSWISPSKNLNYAHLCLHHLVFPDYSFQVFIMLLSVSKTWLRHLWQCDQCNSSGAEKFLLNSQITNISIARTAHLDDTYQPLHLLQSLPAHQKSCRILWQKANQMCFFASVKGSSSAARASEFSTSISLLWPTSLSPQSICLTMSNSCCDAVVSLMTTNVIGGETCTWYAWSSNSKQCVFLSRCDFGDSIGFIFDISFENTLRSAIDRNTLPLRHLTAGTALYVVVFVACSNKKTIHKHCDKNDSNTNFFRH